MADAVREQGQQQRHRLAAAPAPEDSGQAQTHDGRRIEKAGDQQRQIGIREPVEHPREQFLVLFRGLRQGIEKNRHHPAARRKAQQRRGGGPRLRVFLAEQPAQKFEKIVVGPRAHAGGERRRGGALPEARQDAVHGQRSHATQPAVAGEERLEQVRHRLVVPDPAERLQRGLAQTRLAQQRRDGGSGRRVADLAESPQARESQPAAAFTQSAKQRRDRGRVAPAPDVLGGSRGDILLGVLERRAQQRRHRRGFDVAEGVDDEFAQIVIRIGDQGRERRHRGRTQAHEGFHRTVAPAGIVLVPQPFDQQGQAVGRRREKHEIEGGLAHPPAGIAERPDQAREPLRPGAAQTLDRRVADLLVRGGELLAHLLGNASCAPRGRGVPSRCAPVRLAMKSRTASW